jgi:glucose/arabinose dehydrogenase
MTSKYGFSLCFVLVGWLMLITACGQGGPTSSPGSLTSSPESPGSTRTLAIEDSAPPEPTATGLAETTAPAPTQPATSTVTPQSTEMITTPEDTPLATASSTLSAPTFPAAVSLEPVLSGFESPVFVTHAGEESPGASRLFVVEQAGRIQLVENGSVQPTPFLDITDRVGSERNEQGLLSVAFPSDFATSEVFYVNYTDRRGDTVIARYRLMAGDPRQADANSEQKILQIEQPAANHNGGQLQFGPDGYLYIGTGDGGQAGDPWGNAQNPDVLLGKMLRIDVTRTDTYEIPGDNPGLNQPGARPEIWATGVRNPWRFSFDRATGDLYIADVGQNLYEEVNVQAAASPGGENYGWDVMEGSHCFEPPGGCDSEGLVLPVAEYDHGLGCSVTGGYVYRGTGFPQIAGVYFYGDFCSGNIWGLRQEEPGEWETALLLDTDLNITSFGEDSDGELYVIGYSDGTIYQLVALP